MPIHRTFYGSEPLGGALPNIDLLDGVVSDRILNAMEVASAQLTRVGVSHVLIGALAVGAHGHPRATKDVDFLVSNEAFQFHPDGIVTIAPNIPISVGDVAIDPVSISPGEEFLNEAIAAAERSGGIPIVPIETLIYLKLKSPRRKDAVDIIELAKRADLPVESIWRYLNAHAPMLAARFEDLVAIAIEEDL